MKNILQERMQNRVYELINEKLDGQKILNKLKEDLHLIILSYLYSHEKYNRCVMYGGSALRICHKLPRLSVDLDFQVDFPIETHQFCQNAVEFFRHQYGAKIEVNQRASTKRSTDIYWITLTGLDKLKVPGIQYTKLKIRLDFNKFETDKFTTVLVPISYDDNKFLIRTYPLATLMASKIAAVLDRTEYSVVDGAQSILANYKGRDVYDIIWYVQNGIIPNTLYLAKRNHEFENYPRLLKQIKERLAYLNDGGKALRADLLHLYMNPTDLDHWMQHWQQSFLSGLQNYNFYTVSGISQVMVSQDFDTDNFKFRYNFNSQEKEEVFIQIEMSDHFIRFKDLQIHGYERQDIPCELKITKIHQQAALDYAGLFHTMILDYLNRIDHIMPKRIIKTKFVQTRYEGYDAKTKTVFTPHELTHCTLEDLF